MNTNLTVGGHDPRWIEARLRMEEAFPHGCGSRFRFRYLGFGERVLRHGLKACGLYEKGMRNALDIGLSQIDLAFDDLPPAFDGYRILQVSDIHFGALRGLDEAMLELVAATEADLAVLTGDYVGRRNGPLDTFSQGMARVTEALQAPDGVYAILGNHDSVRMAEPFHRLGVHLLGNRSVILKRDSDAVTLTGIDDVYLFHTPLADAALADAPPGFKILLAHSPHMARQAARAGYRIYLTGHTHAGQVCLPGGRPLVSMAGRGGRKLNAGLWRVGEMTGYTNSGSGVSEIPVRFNTRGEVALITLRRARNSA